MADKILVKSNVPLIVSWANTTVNFAVNNPAEVPKEVAEKFIADHPDKFKIVKKKEDE